VTAPPRQMSFQLDHRPALGRAAFLIAPSNQSAVQAISAWRDWPGRRMALCGPARSGKTHLAHVWMQETGAARIDAAALDDLAVRGTIAAGNAVIEDVDRIADLDQKKRDSAEKALFHLLNLAGDEGAWVLLTGREGPARWTVRIPDLASRLAALPVTALDKPDDMLLSSLLVKLFADRQLQVGPDVIRFLARRIERSCAAAEEAVDALDRLSLERKRPVTQHLAAQMLGAGAGE